MPDGSSPANILSRSALGDHCGNVGLKSGSVDTPGHDCSVGVPNALLVTRGEHATIGEAAGRRVRTHWKILKIWSISESPGNNGIPRMTISAMIVPTDHMSIAVE